MSQRDEAGNLVLADLQRASRAGRHHGRAGLSGAQKLEFVERFRKAGARLTLVERMAADPEPSVREVAAVLLGDLGPEPRVLDLWRGLVEDADWEVREWAVDPLSRWAAADLDGGRTRVGRHLAAASPRERRAALLALRHLVLHGRLSPLDALVLAEPLFSDDDPYIAESLGSYVLGDALLRRSPVAVLGWLDAMLGETPGPARVVHFEHLLRSRAAAAHRAALRPLVERCAVSAPPHTGRRLMRWLSLEPTRGTP